MHAEGESFTYNFRLELVKRHVELLNGIWQLGLRRPVGVRQVPLRVSARCPQSFAGLHKLDNGKSVRLANKITVVGGRE